MRLTRRGKQVVLISIMTLLGSVFYMGYALAENRIETVVVQPVLATETKPAFLKVKTLDNALTKYRNATKLSDKELVSLLKAVGFKGKALKEAWAIAKRESNGRPFAFNGNSNTGDSSYGIFQINMIGSLGPDRREMFGLHSNAQLFDPVLNAQVAYYMSNGGTDWKSWKGMTPRAKEWLSRFPS